MLAQQGAIGPRRRDQDAAHAAQRHEAAAAKAMRLRVLIAARRTGTARFGNIIVRSFFDFFLRGRRRGGRARAAASTAEFTQSIAAHVMGVR